MTDIWNPLAKKIKELGKELGSELGGAVSAFSRLVDLPMIRNALAAHENDFAKEYPRQVVLDHANDVLLIAKALRCNACGTFSIKPQNAKVLSCRCGKTVYTVKA